MNNQFNQCSSCYSGTGDLSRCYEQCVDNGIFVVTAQGDADPQQDWNTISFNFEWKDNPPTGQNPFYGLPGELYGDPITFKDGVLDKTRAPTV